MPPLHQHEGGFVINYEGSAGPWSVVYGINRCQWNRTIRCTEILRSANGKKGVSQIPNTRTIF